MQEVRKVIKKLNNTDYKILERIMKNPKTSRTDLSESLNLTPAAISKAIKKMITINLIKEKEILMSTAGRPRIVLSINENYKKIIGICFSVGLIKIVVSNLHGVIEETSEKQFSFKSEEKVLELIDEVLSPVLEKYGKNNIMGIGIIINGIVDRKKGIVIHSSHFKWKNYNFKKEVETKYKIPVIIENNVRAMLMAENRYGCAKNMKNCILLYVKNGIGSSIFLEGKILEGSNMASGEIGHYIVKENSSVQCKCGKFGCLESEYSEIAIINKAIWYLEEKNIKVDKLDIEKIYKLAINKEKPYYDMVKESAYEIGKAMGNSLNILGINNIILAGTMIMTGDLFISNFKRGIEKMMIKEFSEKININITTLGDKLDIYGSISLVVNNLFVNEKLLKI